MWDDYSYVNPVTFCSFQNNIKLVSAYFSKYSDEEETDEIADEEVEDNADD